MQIPRTPALSLMYGPVNMSLKDYPGQFSDPGLAEIRIGATLDDPVSPLSRILNYKYSYFSVSKISSGLGRKAELGEIESTVWRYGLSWDTGFGYALSDGPAGFAVIPYHSSGLIWSSITVVNMGEVPESERLLPERFADGTRFGARNQGGIALQIGRNLVFDAGYERALIFERYLFWKWLGASVIEVISQSIVDRFVMWVIESSPASGPIVYFVLKNALSFAVSELRLERMYYPFASAPPMLQESFKFGITIKFGQASD